ncbi:hypothetical protein NC652_036096 [Populus alba x Populus x berolinensis]|uniref:Uncharacterized protein n=1 Tax=Populus alba x Populus x berolinensis TaxID=444605 RepID=A0AAD6LJ33_9ROSI|nr:hypothetical protein NC652_036096 [Populus alba x Populus x berolinensis]KAJ6967891.1 hypothetical protein NC653_035963 [Populus alba x Populus x berolinensis]
MATGRIMVLAWKRKCCENHLNRWHSVLTQVSAYSTLYEDQESMRLFWVIMPLTLQFLVNKDSGQNSSCW